MTETAAPTLELAGDYQLDPAHTRIGFTARHAMVTKVRGSFGEFRGTATIGEDASLSSTEIVIAASSLDTGQEQRDGHVQGDDFLAVNVYPEITFRSTSVEKDGDTYNITGDLTIRDTTKSVTVPFEFTGLAKDPFGNVRAGFEGATTINRKDWGITFNAALETGGVLVSEKIGLEFDVSAIKEA
ncbi:polyisoprenoid-binding protein [Actinomycetospora sp. NBRC 106375]|uniref:YceI family protein n=1 Tax=Actinomycetospora sp. NBRC 106375 TaxID=3032207 RepID=UPI0024A26EF1|nr:YceI family protein [Actinomycetospora sp. NBRC 106375]GLZ46267.1 polyisoprenoid-binding protein [Actinomycetospora sp. NBRC 106375]